LSWRLVWQVTLPQVLDRAQSDEIVRNMKVIQLVKAAPGIDPAKAKIIMEECGIAEVRRVHELTCVWRCGSGVSGW
jgi:hypothetical protein